MRYWNHRYILMGNSLIRCNAIDISATWFTLYSDMPNRVSCERSQLRAHPLLF